MKNTNKKRIWPILAIMLLTGCKGTLNPHLISDKLDDDLVIATQGDIHFAGNLNAAFDAANSQRKLYYDAIGNRSIVRNVTGGVLLGLSAATVYKGFTPANTDTSKRLASILFGLSGATYGLTTFYSNKDAELAYLAGYKLTTCSMLRMRPFLIEQTDYSQWLSDLDEFNDKIEALDRKTLKLQSLTTEDKDVAKLGKALKTARKLLDNARKLQAYVDTAGFNLRRQTELINAAVSENIQHNERDLGSLAPLLADPAKLAKGFGDVKPIPIELSLEDFEEPDRKHDGKPPKDPKPGTAAPADGTPATASTDAATAKVVADLKKDVTDLSTKVTNLTKDVSTFQHGLNGLMTKIAQLKPGTNSIATDKLAALNDMATLYAKRRDINAQLIKFNTLHKSVKKLAACKFSSEPELTVVPDVDQLAAKPGGTYQFTINGGHGYPQVTLSGVKDKSVEVETVLTNGALVATVSVHTDAADEDVTLHISDSQGAYPQETVLQIKTDAATAAASTTAAKAADQAQKAAADSTAMMQATQEMAKQVMMMANQAKKDAATAKSKAAAAKKSMDDLDKKRCAMTPKPDDCQAANSPPAARAASGGK